MQRAYRGTTQRLNGRTNWTGLVRPIPSRLEQPLRWNKPRRVFVNSMSDLFHENVSTKFIVDVSEVMKAADWHTYQVLTKRAGRLRALLEKDLRSYAELKHIWWGVSVENRLHGLERIAELRRAPAVVRFLSIEPLLEDLGEIDLTGIHWVIAGGESGPRSRPMRQSWLESIRDQCAAAGVAFFFQTVGCIRAKGWSTEASRKEDSWSHLGRAHLGRIPVALREQIQTEISPLDAADNVRQSNLGDLARLARLGATIPEARSETVYRRLVCEACDTFPNCLANSSSPTFVLITFCA